MESINIDKTKKFIDVCRKSNISKFIFPSSSSVYGIDADVVNESSAFVNPQSPYADAKYEIEKYIDEKQIDIVIDKKNIFIANRKNNITEDIVKIIDEKLK